MDHDVYGNLLQMILGIKNKLEQNAMLHELVSGGVISFVMQGVGMLSGYLLMALIAKYFGASILGIYSFSYTALMLAVIVASLGLDMVILKLAARGEGASSVATLKKIYSVVIPSTIFLVLASIFFVHQYATLFFEAAEYKVYLTITSLALIFSVILAINIEYLRAKGNIPVSEFMRNACRPLLSILIIVIVSGFYYDVYVPGYALCISSFIACMISIYIVFWRRESTKSVPASNCPETITALMAGGLPMQVSMLAFYMISNMVIFFIEGYESSALVGFMLVSIKLAGLVNMPLMVLNKVCAPKFSKLYADNQHIQLQEYLNQTTKLAFYVAVVLGLFLVVFSEYLLAIFGHDFIQAKNLLYILVCGQLISCASGSVGLFMMMTGNEKTFRNIAVIVMLISSVCYWLVLPSYGAIGAAVVLATSQAALNIVSVVYIKYRLGFVTMYLPFQRRIHISS